MITLIAEKPSVGQDFARITGCKIRKDGYMEGGRIGTEPCRVTWTFGHLLQLSEDDSTLGLHWKSDNLPVMPQPFRLSPRLGKDRKPDPACLKQLKIIEKLFAETDTIINCGDAGREGELIQRYVYDFVCEHEPKCRKPVLRLWISSMTDDAIRDGLRALRPSAEYDPLFLAGKARAEADWLVGINATEALTLSIKKANSNERRVFSLGRVQTPVLALVCNRYLENKTFKPIPFWTVKLQSESKGTTFHVLSERRFDSYESAASVSKRASLSLMTVTEAEHGTRIVKAPLLHDQTSLQQEASKRYDMSPDEVLSIVQRLYEQKIVTYPRTGSRFIPNDVLRTMLGRIQTLAAHSQDARIKAAAIQLAGLPISQYNRQSVNDGKVTDHYALLVEKTAPPELTGKDLKVYNLIAERMLEAFSPSCECDVLTIKCTCVNETFRASSTTVVKPGWKGIRGDYGDKDAEKNNEMTDNGDLQQRLPELQASDVLSVNKSEIIKGETKPKPIYTYDSLLQAMKTAGNDSEDDEIKSAMKDVGIGTAATRASILSILLDIRKYIKKEGKKIVPTETGIEVYNLVKDMAIADVAMTSRWEIALSLIADGKMNARDFDTKIRTFTEQITRQLLSTQVGDGIQKAAEAENIICPLCGGVVKVWDTNAKCTNSVCGLYMNRTVFGKRLSESMIKHFLENGKTGLIKGFVSKAGKSFDSRLKLAISEKEGRKYANAELVFNDNKPKTYKYTKK